ncbi:MAG TPA: Hsp70 family protein [Rhodanobacteraceae bacterium]|nr:Hsp70 family protein [Rhodanobacteraceae bacterium]
MKASDLKLRLLNRLRAAGKPAVAAGIDLGTTKSCIAYAQYDPKKDTLECACVPFERPDGTRSIAFPSAVAQRGDERVFGAEALALRRTRGILPERNLFHETKNLIGLRYTFKNAPQGLRNPAEVATALIGHMRKTARGRLPGLVLAPVVVTVPASFHAAQREATVYAAEKAFEQSRESHAVRLLDEPYAAFADLKFREPENASSLLREGANVLVFDFGGGTCDVAIFRIDSVNGGTLGARLLATSRYHRLGGGDIDRAIVHDVLIPQLLAQHGIERWSVSWATRSRELERQLLDTAERLKVALNMRLEEYRAAGMEAPADLACSSVDLQVECEGKQLAFKQPSLDVAAFGKLLVPFLDPEPIPEAGDEYVLRNSIFAPILQALVRAKLERDELTGVLLCGSSSLLVPVQEALKKFLPGTRRVMLGTPEDLQSAVARGAAIQALSLQVLGQPVIEPVCSADVSLRLVEGEAVMARAGDAVPHCSESPILLRPPRDCAQGGMEIAVEVLIEGKRSAGVSLWHLPAPVRADERLELQWRMDENQCVELTLSRPGDARTDTFSQRFDAPIMHRDMSQLVRCRLLEREERMRTDAIPRTSLGNEYEQHARDCATVGEHQKALHYLSLALQEKGESIGLLTLRGLWREAIGDKDGARDSYERAGEASAPKFNLGLLHYRGQRYAQALAHVEAAIELENDRGYHALRGDILEKLGRHDEARVEWQDATDGNPDLPKLKDFTLGWMETAARKLGNEPLRKRIQEQRHKFAVKAIEPASQQGELPARYAAEQTPKVMFCR